MRGGAVHTGSLYSVSGQRKYLTQDERARFIAAAERCPRANVRTLCLALAWTGCRISEALALTPSCIECASGFIAIRSLKKRSDRVVIREVPVPDALLNEIDAVHHLDALDINERLWSFSRCRAWQLIKNVMDEASIPHGLHATPKGLRHGFGLHAIRSGVPINLVQRWLGHARMETTAIYLQAMGSEERAIAERMWNLH
ncbi:MAG: tyrosine-type recombinase/integrase [Pseudomonadota bacterium]|jgi:integrase